MSLNDLFTLTFQYPWLFVTMILVVGILFVNGWSDAPNAISTCISTKAMKIKPALIMTGILNFVGLLIMFYISTGVAQTIQDMISFTGPYTDFNLTCEQSFVALKILSASMLAVIIFGVFASLVGIPSSQTHSLVGGLVGAGLGGVVMGKKDILINFGMAFEDPLGKVFYGLVLSCAFGFIAGFLTTKLIQLICKNMNRNHTRKFFKWSQIFGGASLALVHGAQDGMQFVGIFFIIVQIAARLGGFKVTNEFFNASNLWYVGLICAFAIGFGTLCGGKKIIKKVAMSMIKLEPYEGFATDLSSAIGIFIATYFGFPISTSQVKAFAILGAGATKGVRRVKWKTVLEMVVTWVLTFPGCGLAGFLITCLLLLF
jgi:PiT family inorganic phosphate transporter